MALPITVGTPVPLGVSGYEAYSISPVGDANGRFVVAWVTEAPRFLYARVFESSGQPSLPAIEVASGAFSPSPRVACVMNVGGDVLVAWIDGAGPGNLWARRYRSDGSPATAAMLLSNGATPSLGAWRPIALALHADGSFGAAWVTRDGGPDRLLFQSYDPSGHATRLPATVAESPAIRVVALDFDPQGRAALAYSRSPGGDDEPFFGAEVWARLYDAAGVARSAELRLSPPAVGASSYYRLVGLSVRPDGAFEAGYQECDPVWFEICRASLLATFSPNGDPQGVVNLWPAGAVANDVGTVMSSDRGSNLATFAQYSVDQSGATPHNGIFRLANPTGEVGTATVIGPQVAQGPSEYEFPLSLVALGSGSFAVVWQKYQTAFPPTLELYLQPYIAGGESGPASSLYLVKACRLVDTRVTNAPLVAGTDRVFPATGLCEIPSGARALVANAVATEATLGGHLRLYPPDQLVPQTSTVPYKAGDTRGSFVTVPLDPAGRLGVRSSQASGTVHLVIDVMGYFKE